MKNEFYETVVKSIVTITNTKEDEFEAPDEDGGQGRFQEHPHCRDGRRAALYPSSLHLWSGGNPIQDPGLEI